MNDCELAKRRTRRQNVPGKGNSMFQSPEMRLSSLLGDLKLQSAGRMAKKGPKG